MKVAVITPYHDEPDVCLHQCHDSVRGQVQPCTHIFVADGKPNALIDSFDAQHIVLHHGHADYGDTPIAMGSMSAIGQGFDAICYLDADNWYTSRHTESMIALQAETGADVCTSARAFHRLDGTYMGLCPYSDGELIVDTSCYFLTRRAFPLAAEWAMMPPDVHAIGDRVFLHMLKDRGLDRAHTWRASVCYRATAVSDYRIFGEAAPPGVDRGRDGVAQAVDALLRRGGPDLRGRTDKERMAEVQRRVTREIY